MHIHIGIESKAAAISILNQARTWLPHLLALSSNSPFWMGRFTGIKSYRSVVWQGGSPRNGLPEIISSLQEYNHYVDILMRTGCITSEKDIWWDIRPHAVYPTIEFRICDMPASIQDIISLAALCQALIATLFWKYQRQKTVPPIPRDLLAENKWKAMRYGLDATLVDFTNYRTVSMRDSLHELLNFVHQASIDLGLDHEMQHIYTLLEDKQGSGADRQIAIYQQTKDIQKVVHFLIHQTMQESLKTRQCKISD